VRRRRRLHLEQPNEFGRAGFSRRLKFIGFIRQSKPG